MEILIIVFKMPWGLYLIRHILGTTGKNNYTAVHTGEKHGTGRVSK